MPIYEILLHGCGLRLIDQKGRYREGGVYVWRAASADDESSAVALATASLLNDSSFTSEVWNASLHELKFTPEEIRKKARWRRAKETAPVFYIEDSD